MLPPKLSQLIEPTFQRFTRRTQNFFSPESGARGIAILKNPFWLFLIGAVGVHTAFWLLLPNPLKKAEKPQEIEVKSTVPVVTLPNKQSNTLLNRNSSLDLSKFSSSALKDPLSVAPLDLSKFSTDPSMNLSSAPPSNAFSPLFNPNLNQTPTTPTPKTSKTTDRTVSGNTKPLLPNDTRLPKESNLQPEIRGNAIQASVNSSTKNGADNGNSNAGQNNSPQVPESNANNEEVTKIFAEYGQRIFQTTIPQLGATVRADKVEPGVDWIPPDKEMVKGIKKGVVEVAFLVNPDGKVERVLFKPSGIDQLDREIKKLVRGYYDKFLPLNDTYIKSIDIQNRESLRGKYRYVTVKYEI